MTDDFEPSTPTRPTVPLPQASALPQATAPGAPTQASPAASGDGAPATPAGSSDGAPASPAASTCPMCQAPTEPGAVFCEACGADLDPSAAGHADAPRHDPTATVVAAATPKVEAEGDESPLDVGWTGPVTPAGNATPGPAAPPQKCAECGEGTIVDGYCDTCGSKPPDPRNHFVEDPAPWVAGVCDIGKRHHRNEDAMSLAAHGASALASDASAVLVVCDGVTMATDSHIASLAAATAARTHLARPFAQGVGTADSWAMAAGQALTKAVELANAAVVKSVEEQVDEPPSCTFVAAVVQGDTVVTGNVGDSRAYWLPDAESSAASQLGRDDSFAQEQIDSGIERKVAEEGPNAHSITRWLGRDAPEDLTPHLTTTKITEPGWLLVCSDGLWNYCSDAAALRSLLRDTAASAGSTPAGLAAALADWANEQGGRDNITVALARLGAEPEQGTPAEGEAESQSTAETSTAETSTAHHPDPKA